MKNWNLISFVGLFVVGAIAMWTLAMAQESTRSDATTGQELTQVPKESADHPISFWMTKKLDYSKSLIEHLTKGDFEQLQQDAVRLRALGKMERLVRRKNPDYLTQLRTFDTALSELIRHARKENSNGAVLAFNQMTSSCVACHTLIREGVE